jgi:O-antigen/teichoic acid export membrane protein
VASISSAVSWSALESVVRHAIQVAVTMVLARWVAPDDFGVFALVGVVTLFAGTLVDGGLSNALIQTRDPGPQDESTVFWFNLAAAVFVAALIVLAGWAFAEPLGLGSRVQLPWAIGAIVVCGALQCVPVALASRALEFRVQAHASLAAVAAGGIVALWLAHRGAGVWALVLQALATSAIQAGLLWVMTRWRPRAAFSVASLRRLFGFGRYVLFANALDAVVGRLYLPVIAQVYSPADLGQFSRAAATRDGPQAILTGMFARVALPLFAGKAEEPPELRASLRRSIVAVMAVNLPTMAALGVMADDLVPVLYGPNWGDSVPLLRILCVAGAFWPLHTANIQVLLAQGRASLLLRTELAKKGILVVVTIAMAMVSLEAVAWGLVACSIAAHGINAHYVRKSLGYGFFGQLRDAAPYAVLAAAMAASIAGVAMLLPSADVVLRVLVLAGVGACVYAAGLVLLQLEAVALLRDLMPARRGTVPSA